MLKYSEPPEAQKKKCYTESHGKMSALILRFGNEKNNLFPFLQLGI